MAKKQQQSSSYMHESAPMDFCSKHNRVSGLYNACDSVKKLYPIPSVIDF